MKSPAERMRVMSEADKAKRKAEQARVTGAEYRVVYLEQHFRQVGCDLCRRYRPPAHQHHTKTGGTGRKADASETVIICARCHQLGHDKGWTAVLAANGLPPDHLDLRAAEHAATATAAGYLPVELCEECGKWHSKKFMLWEIEAAHFPGTTPGEATGRRICTTCAPEGPP